MLLYLRILSKNCMCQYKFTGNFKVISNLLSFIDMVPNQYNTHLMVYYIIS